MGMSFQYSGSASYPRFYKELEAIVNVFGGKLNDNIQKQQEQVVENSVDWWFGKPLSDVTGEKFVFPEGSSPILVKWANNPFKCLTFEETEEILNLMIDPNKYLKVKEASEQILSEFETSVDENEGWNVCE